MGKIQENHKRYAKVLKTNQTKIKELIEEHGMPVGSAIAAKMFNIRAFFIKNNFDKINDIVLSDVSNDVIFSKDKVQMKYTEYENTFNKNIDAITKLIHKHGITRGLRMVHEKYGIPSTFSRKNFDISKIKHDTNLQKFNAKQDVIIKMILKGVSIEKMSKKFNIPVYLFKTQNIRQKAIMSQYSKDITGNIEIDYPKYWISVSELCEYYKVDKKTIRNMALRANLFPRTKQEVAVVQKYIESTRTEFHEWCKGNPKRNKDILYKLNVPSKSIRTTKTSLDKFLDRIDVEQYKLDCMDSTLLNTDICEKYNVDNKLHWRAKRHLGIQKTNKSGNTKFESAKIKKDEQIALLKRQTKRAKKAKYLMYCEVGFRLKDLLKYFKISNELYESITDSIYSIIKELKIDKDSFRVLANNFPKEVNLWLLQKNIVSITKFGLSQGKTVEFFADNLPISLDKLGKLQSKYNRMMEESNNHFVYLGFLKGLKDKNYIISCIASTLVYEGNTKGDVMDIMGISRYAFDKATNRHQIVHSYSSIWYALYKCDMLGQYLNLRSNS